MSKHRQWVLEPEVEEVTIKAGGTTSSCISYFLASCPFNQHPFPHDLFDNSKKPYITDLRQPMFLNGVISSVHYTNWTSSSTWFPHERRIRSPQKAWENFISPSLNKLHFKSWKKQTFHITTFFLYIKNSASILGSFSS